MFSEFTNLYSMSKTLKFELKPVGATLEHIKQKGFIEKDKELAEKYKLMKETIDEYHKEFINKALVNYNSVKFEGLLEEFAEIYNQPREVQKTDEHKEKLKKQSEILRKELVGAFKTGAAKPIFSDLFKKELIQKHLREFAQSRGLYYEDDFNKFTTYFSGLHENRKNMYSEKDQQTSIANRAVNENFTKSLDNPRTLKFIEKNHPVLWANFTRLDKELSGLVESWHPAVLTKPRLYAGFISQSGIDSYNSLLGGASKGEGQFKIQGMNELINLYNQQHSGDKSYKKVPRLKPLYKQILSDRGSLSFLPEAFESFKELGEAVNTLYVDHLLHIAENQELSVADRVVNLINSLDSYDQKLIYINPKSTSYLSHQVYGDFGFLGRALDYHYRTELNPQYEVELDKPKLSIKKKENLEKIKKTFINSAHSIAELETAAANYLGILDPKDAEALVGKSIAKHLTDFLVVHGETGSVAYTRFLESKYSPLKGFLNTEAQEPKGESRKKLF